MLRLQGSSIKSSTAAANYATSGLSEVFEQQIPRIPAKRLGNPEEVTVVCVQRTAARIIYKFCFLRGDLHIVTLRTTLKCRFRNHSWLSWHESRDTILLVKWSVLLLRLVNKLTDWKRLNCQLLAFLVLTLIITPWLCAEIHCRLTLNLSLCSI